MSWRVARSLDVLLAQLNEAAPRRSKRSDGSIGDAAHSSRTSDHNPDKHRVVRARDFTHDPKGGLNCHRLADALQEGRDPRIKYVIWNRRIMAGENGPAPWFWRPYSGKNPHTLHLHLSVVADSRADDERPWSLTVPSSVSPPPKPTTVSEEDDVALSEGDRGNAVTVLQRELVAWNGTRRGAPEMRLNADGVYGPFTAEAVRTYQKAAGLPVTGNADGVTCALLFTAVHRAS